MELSIKLTCPPDVSEGQLVVVATPDGREFDTAVPAGVQPGSVFFAVVDDAEARALAVRELLSHEELETPTPVRKRRRAKRVAASIGAGNRLFKAAQASEEKRRARQAAAHRSKMSTVSSHTGP